MVTIILPISRKEYLLPVFECLASLEQPVPVDLLLIVDGDKELRKMVDNLLDIVVSKYGKVGVTEFGTAPEQGLNNRRYRIAEIHNFAKQFVGDESDHVFLLEDDTVCPPDTLTKMLFHLQNSGAVFIQGLEIGRWKSPYIGAWHADDYNDPKEIKSAEPRVGIIQIDAGGLFCCLVNAKEYREHHFEPFDKQGINGLGCDVNFGISLKRKGFNVIMDYSIDCGHYKEGKQLHLSNTRTVIVTFEKDSNNKWLSRQEWAEGVI